MSDNLVQSYENELGYPPQTLKKLWNWVQSKDEFHLKFTQVQQIFAKMKKSSNDSKMDDETVKGDHAFHNPSINTNVVEITLIATPDAQQTSNTSKNAVIDNNHVKALDVFSTYLQSEAIERITIELLPGILKWANDSQNGWNITWNELQEGYKYKYSENIEQNENKIEINEMKENDSDLKLNEILSMVEMLAKSNNKNNERVHKLLIEYQKEIKHMPKSALQLLNFMNANERLAQNLIISFEDIQQAFVDYEAYASSVEQENIEIQNAAQLQNKQEMNANFDCKNILEKYVSAHGQPKNDQMFYKHCLQLGFSLDFKTFKEEYDKAQGIQKKVKKKKKIKNSR